MFFTFARNCEETCESDMKITKAQKILHTKFVKSTMRNSEPNRLRKESIPLSNDSSNCPLLGDFKKKVNCDQPGNVIKSVKQYRTLLNVLAESSAKIFGGPPRNQFQGLQKSGLNNDVQSVSKTTHAKKHRGICRIGYICRMPSE